MMSLNPSPPPCMNQDRNSSVIAVQLANTRWSSHTSVLMSEAIHLAVTCRTYQAARLADMRPHFRIRGNDRPNTSPVVAGPSVNACFSV